MMEPRFRFQSLFHEVAMWTLTLPSSDFVLPLLSLIALAAQAMTAALAAGRRSMDWAGVCMLGCITALGGGTIRDVLLDALPPATFLDWRYLTVAAAGGVIAFLLGRHLERLTTPIEVLDAVGLALFAVTGAGKALQLGFGPAQAVIVGAITAVGGGTIRDVLIGRVPSVLSSGLYAVPALMGATVAVVAAEFGARGVVPAVGAAVLCFVVRMLGVRYDLHAPFPPAPPDPERPRG
jgi:uncharacterized membrane protein YeiH